MKNLLSHVRAFKYQGLLLLAAAIWGLGTVLVKSIVDEIPPFWLVGIRFLAAGIIFVALFAPQLIKLARERRLADHIKVSLVLGVTMIAGYMANSLGMVDTTAAKSSFLTGLYCVIVPFIAWIVMRKRPRLHNMVAALLCVAGIGLVSLVGQTNLTMGWGDAVTLLSALFLAGELALTSKFAPGRNMAVITTLQFLIGGIVSLCVGALTEPLPDFALFADPGMALSIAYLVLGATCAALLLQNIGLAKVAPAAGSLLLSFESVFGVLFSVLLLHETLTIPMVCGFCLIFAAVVVSEWLPSRPLKIPAPWRRSKDPQAQRRPYPLNESRASEPNLPYAPISPGISRMSSEVPPRN